MPRIPISEMPEKYIKGTATYLNEGNALEECGTHINGNYYLKVGHTTGVTVGVCNGNWVN